MGSELLCKRGCYGSTELSIVAPSDAGANFFCNRPRCFRNSPAPRSALRPKRVTLRATQGFAPTGVRELIHQEVGPNQKIKRGQIKLTESKTHRLATGSEKRGSRVVFMPEQRCLRAHRSNPECVTYRLLSSSRTSPWEI